MSSQDTVSMSSQDTVRKGRPPKTKYQTNKKNTIHNFRHRKNSNISKTNSLSVHDNNTSSSHSTRIETSLTKVCCLSIHLLMRVVNYKSFLTQYSNKN